MRMNRCHIKSWDASRRRMVAFAVAVVLLVFGVVVGSAVAVTYEQAGVFAGSAAAPKEPGVFPEEVQLGGVGGMAVNYTGAGGVPAGTVYAIGRDLVEGTLRVAMYVPKAGGLDSERRGRGLPCRTL